MSKKSRRIAGAVIFGVIVGLVATACGGGSSSDGAEVKWAFNLPTSWDPVTSRTGNDINTISLAYASLTRLDAEGNVEPSLAESWKYNADGTAVTFSLRDGLTFSDGTTLDSQAVKAFFDRGKTQDDSFLRDQLAGVTEVTADTATDVTLHLADADYQIPYLSPGAPVRSPARRRPPTRRSSACGRSGPVRSRSPISSPRITRTSRRTRTTGRENIHIDHFELSVAPDPATLVAGVQSGSIDFATLPALQSKEAEAAGLDVTVKPSLAANDVSINLNKAPFDNPKIVEAFRYAFDRQAFVDVITNGWGAPPASRSPTVTSRSTRRSRSSGTTTPTRHLVSSPRRATRPGSCRSRSRRSRRPPTVRNSCSRS